MIWQSAELVGVCFSRYNNDRYKTLWGRTFLSRGLYEGKAAHYNKPFLHTLEILPCLPHSWPFCFSLPVVWQWAYKNKISGQHFSELNKITEFQKEKETKLSANLHEFFEDLWGFQKRVFPYSAEWQQRHIDARLCHGAVNHVHVNLKKKMSCILF